MINARTIASRLSGSAVSREHAVLPGTALSVQDLSVSYGKRLILNGINLTLDQGRSATIIGPSGGGKSTFLNAILGFVRIDAGQIRISGHQIRAGYSRNTVTVRRESVGVVFQDARLLPELSPLENVVLAGLLAGVPAKEAAARARELLDLLKVPQGKRSVTQFSGGEQQRVAVARALMNAPKLLVADEPTGSLDPENRDAVADLLFDLPSDLNCALLVVTHDPLVASRGDQRYSLTGGQLVTRQRASCGAFV
ncbi:MAG: ATP-binding cassette domain-containing protein [Bifidobacteriaceae bacterium]|jgi:putative ABC transport system ATP-binding protein/lipoprotein-releasing system ATP-binding protein|nr:ATP-binding cassette domain-containing protein [Bifidobacteriaceae bacterium]